MLGSNIRRMTGQSRSSPVPDLGPSPGPIPLLCPRSLFLIYIFSSGSGVSCTVACYKSFVTFLFVWGSHRFLDFMYFF